MSASARGGWLLLVLGLLVGCKTPVALQLQQSQAEQQKILAQNKDLQTKLAAIDEQNSQATESIAQLNRQVQLEREQAAALRDQLASATSQVARLREENTNSTKQIEALQASARRRGGATITPNNSLQNELPDLGIVGVEAQRDEATVRVVIPSSRLFDAEDARLKREGAQLVGQVAQKLARVYPQQQIGVEGHTDNIALAQGKYASHHQLSAAQAQAVFEQLVAGGYFGPEQLRVVGHGAGRPLFSNSTQAGRERNQRIELVIYPETAEARRN
ncbi:MAG: OmpA family protein [Planctomycetia bacterium]|nr:OmpA family protein [Planctomycetia bacterium]